MSEPYDPLTANPTFYRSSLPGFKPPPQLSTERQPISPRSQPTSLADPKRADLGLHAQLGQPQGLPPTPTASTLQRQNLQKQLDATKDIMADNARKMVERGELSDNMEERAGQLSIVSKNFKRSATDIRKRMWLKNAKWWIILGVIVVLIIVGIVVGAIKHKPYPSEPISGSSTGAAPTPLPGLDTVETKIAWGV